MTKLLSKILVTTANGSLLFLPLAATIVKANHISHRPFKETIRKVEIQDFKPFSIEGREPDPVEEIETPDLGEEVFTEETANYQIAWSGQKLTPQAGSVYGPSGKETYYNLDMSYCISIMRQIGYDEQAYPYWIREDGAKMLGNYVCIAAGFDVRPRGTIVETSLGTGICVDTGTFAYTDPYKIDIAVTW